MSRAKSNGIELEYDAFGREGDPPMVLIMGFAMQMIGWDEAFCEELASRGFRVVRFDNRDIGLSTKVDARVPDIGAILRGDRSSVPYSLDDMAKDTVGLLDALGIDAAHVVGLSMGGMIAQLVAAHHPARVLSLCSIMSRTDEPGLGQASPAAVAALFAPAPAQRDANIEYGVGVWRVIGSPGFPFDEERTRARVARAFDRSFYPAGVARQLGAVLSARDRTRELAAVRAPTLVIHGTEDALINVSGGEATARAIPGATLMKIEGMGHDLPPAAWPRIIDAIAANARRA